jgi:hypothetical protein
MRNIKLLIVLWEKFWFRKIPSVNIQIFRLLFGIYLFIYFAWSFPNIELFFSNQGIYSTLFVPSEIAPNIIVAWLIYSFTLLVCLLYAIGYKFRIISWLMLFLFIYYFVLNIGVKACTYERLIFIFLLIMALSSFDITKHKPNKLISAWSQRILTLYISFFYIDTGLYKLLIPAWHSSLVIKGAITGIYGSQVGYWLLNLGLPNIFFDISSWGIIIFELSGFMFFSRKYQKLFFVLGFFFHLSVGILMSLPQFMILPCAYILFVNPSEVKNIIYTILQHKYFNFQSKVVLQIKKILLKI